MTLDEVIVARLKANAGLVAIVDNRIFPDFVPKGESAPAIVLHRVSNDPVAGVAQDSGAFNANFQVTLFSPTKSQLREMEGQVFAALPRGLYSSADVAIWDLQLSSGEDGYSDDDQAHSVAMLAAVYYEDSSLYTPLGD